MSAFFGLTRGPMASDHGNCFEMTQNFFNCIALNDFICDGIFGCWGAVISKGSVYNHILAWNGIY
jgi:hypothetical protein